MAVELLRDLDREDAWLLVVDGSEQSYVDLREPGHLEFEYVQHLAHVLATRFPAGRPLRAVHFGGGLCTVPRWIADRHPGSRQLVIEKSAEIEQLCRSIGLPDGVELRSGDVVRWLLPAGDQERGGAAAGAVDLCVVDVYSGPETVVAPFALGSLQAFAAGRILPGGLFAGNLSDAAPFDLARSAAAACLTVWRSVVAVAEPPVLRGRRSGNVVLAATDGPLDVDDLTRRCAGGLVRGRVLAGADLRDWIGDAVPAATPESLPRSGERGVRRIG